MNHLTRPAQFRVFEEQSVIPIPTFFDVERTIAHTHPVLADADGHFPPIYIGAPAPPEVFDIEVSNVVGDIMWRQTFTPATLAVNAKTQPFPLP